MIPIRKSVFELTWTTRTGDMTFKKTNRLFSWAQVYGAEVRLRSRTQFGATQLSLLLLSFGTTSRYWSSSLSRILTNSGLFITVMIISSALNCPISLNKQITEVGDTLGLTRLHSAQNEPFVVVRTLYKIGNMFFWLLKHSV